MKPIAINKPADEIKRLLADQGLSVLLTEEFLSFGIDPKTGWQIYYFRVRNRDQHYALLNLLEQIKSDCRICDELLVLDDGPEDDDK